MKQIWTGPSPAFTPGTAGLGTLNFSNWGSPAWSFGRLYCIIDKTQNLILFLPPAVGYTSVSGAILTLSPDTSGCAAADLLEIIYEVPGIEQAPVDPVKGLTITSAEIRVIADILQRQNAILMSMHLTWSNYIGGDFNNPDDLFDGGLT